MSCGVRSAILTLSIIAAMIAIGKPVVAQNISVEIGTVDGKTYFAEFTIMMTWVKAKAYCESHGLQLASIESAAQAQFLDEAYARSGSDKPYFSGYVWTSGRDAREAREFTWNTNGAQVGETLVRIDNAITAYSDCLGYLSIPETSYLRIIACPTSLGALCERRNNPVGTGSSSSATEAPPKPKPNTSSCLHLPNVIMTSSLYAIIIICIKYNILY